MRIGQKVWVTWEPTMKRTLAVVTATRVGVSRNSVNVRLLEPSRNQYRLPAGLKITVHPSMCAPYDPSDDSAKSLREAPPQGDMRRLL